MEEATSLPVANRDDGIAVTVVFLEMARQPKTVVHPPANRQVALLKCRDVPLAYYRFLMDRVGRKWHWVNRLRMSDTALESILRDKRCEVSVLYLDGAPAGFFEIFRKTPERAELSYFGMMEQALGQGIGRWFLAASIGAAWQPKTEILTVQTCTLDHPAALPLYQRVGFQPVGTAHETVYPMSLAERAEVLARP